MYWKNQKKTEYFRFTVLREEEEWIESDYTTFNGQMQEKKIKARAIIWVIYKKYMNYYNHTRN